MKFINVILNTLIGFVSQQTIWRSYDETINNFIELSLNCLLGVVNNDQVFLGAA